MNIEDQKKAEQFYIYSDIDGIHTPKTNTVEINYLDMVKLMHEYAQEQVKNLTTPVVNQQRELLVAFSNWLTDQLNKGYEFEIPEDAINIFLSNQQWLTDENKAM